MHLRWHFWHRGEVFSQVYVALDRWQTACKPWCGWVSHHVGTVVQCLAEDRTYRAVRSSWLNSILDKQIFWIRCFEFRDNSYRKVKICLDLYTSMVIADQLFVALFLTWLKTKQATVKTQQASCSSSVWQMTVKTLTSITPAKKIRRMWLNVIDGFSNL